MKKILLIHGWNYHNYTKMTKETDAWHNRKQLIETLQEEFKVYKLASAKNACKHNKHSQKGKRNIPNCHTLAFQQIMSVRHKLILEIFNEQDHKPYGNKEQGSLVYVWNS